MPHRALHVIAIVVIGWACSRTALYQPPPPPPPHGMAITAYHFDTTRTGWSDAETKLTPKTIRAGLRRAWSTDLDPVTLTYLDTNGITQTTTFPPRLFATPLYLDDVVLSAPSFAGISTSVVFAATTSGIVYAISAVETPNTKLGLVPAGTILWRTALGTPAYVAAMDAGTPLGVLSTPIIDRSTTPPTLYVTAVDASAGWQAFAIDVTNGEVISGWPVTLDPVQVSQVDRNRPPTGNPPPMAVATIASQRAALALAQGTLYIGFGSYYDGAIGWMVAIDVAERKIVASFSGSPTVPTPDPNDPTNLASAGMWGSGGPAVASDGRVFTTTGNSPATAFDAPGVWGNSLLAWAPGLALTDTYSPFNYCVMDAGDTDVGGSSPAVFDLDPSRTTTPHLAVFGGKQGVVYLVDRDQLGGSTLGRPKCDANPANNDPSSDTSLFGPSRPGPLSVFGPYSDANGDNELDHAKMRTTPAVFRPSSGEVYVFVSGTSRDASNLDNVKPPCVVRLHVHVVAGEKAYLEGSFDANTNLTMRNPGSPIVTSHDGGQDPVVWVLDSNARRTSPVEPKSNYSPPSAILNALDGTTLETLWQSSSDDLGPSGKYAHVIVAHGTVYVGTDRITAFVPQ